MSERLFLLHLLSAVSLSCFVVVSLTDFANSTLVVVPSNTVATNGSNTQLHCSTNLSTPVHWQHIPLGSTLPADVYLQNTIVNGYVGRFQVQVDNNTGAYNLVINNIQFGDAGVFRCLDNRGEGEQKDAKLNVTENTELQLMPKLAEVQVGDSFQLTCKTYYKDEAIRWQRIPMENTLPVDVYLDDQLVNDYDTRYEVRKEVEAGINKLIINRAEMGDSGTFRCIDRSGHGQQVDSLLTVVGPPKCHSSINASCDLDDMENVTLTCNVKFSGKMSPTIEWKHEGKNMLGATSTFSADVQSYLTIKIDQRSSYSSLYSCLSLVSNSSCTIRIQNDCTVSGESTVTPLVDPSSSGGQNTAAIVAPIVVVVVVGIIIIIIVFFIRRRRKAKNANRNDDPFSGERLTAPKQSVQ